MASLATAVAFSFSTLTLPSPDSGVKGTRIGGGTANIRGLKSKNVSFRGLQVKANVQVPHKINGITVATYVQDGVVSSENFSFRSYEIDADGKVSIETLSNYFQVCSCAYLYINDLVIIFFENNQVISMLN